MQEIAMAKLLVITVCYKSNSSLSILAESLNKQAIRPWKWILIDNAPLSNPVLNLNTTFPLHIISGNEGDGFGAGCNAALDLVHEMNFEGWIWLLNPDTYLPTSNHIENILNTLANVDANTILGTAIEGLDHQLEQSAGWIRKGLGYRKSQITKELFTQASRPYIEVDWVSGCNLIFRPSSFSTPLRFDNYFPLYFEDIDFCLRARLHGGKCIWLASLSISHQKSTGSECSLFRRERLKAISQIHFLCRYQPWWVTAAHALRIIALALQRLPTQFGSSRGTLAGVLQGLFDHQY
jgi:GT2 family glycosyltransferase